MTLYEVDLAKPLGQRIQPVCEAPCARSVDVAGRLFFFEGDSAPKSRHFGIAPRSPDVTIVAHAGSRPLRHWGIATTVLGAATIPAGFSVLFLSLFPHGEGFQRGEDDATRGVVAGLVMMTLGVFGTIAGVSMIDYAKTTFDIREGAPSFRAGRVRLDGGGVAVEF